MKAFVNRLLLPIRASEHLLEYLLFRHRRWIFATLVLLTLVLSWQAALIRPDASFIKMIPSSHPYVTHYLAHRDDLAGLGNSIRVVVETTEGDILQPSFQQALKEITDELFFIPGVDRAALKSIWTPNVRWTEVTEEGFVGGPVIPEDYDASPAALDQLRLNILRSGQVGRLVAEDFRSALIEVPLLDSDPETGARLDYRRFSNQLEQRVRDAFQNDSLRIHITGFAKIVGDLIGGALEVAVFFGVAFLVTLVLLYLYSGSLQATLIPLLCSLVAVLWQLGLLRLLGYGLDPYSMLVPFLVFAIAVSHGVQIVNTVRLEAAAGADNLTAAKRAFRAIYIAGLTALLSDAIGFITLMVIDIEVIRDLALAASLGVLAIVITNLLLLPLLLSWSGVGQRAIARAQRADARTAGLWRGLTHFARPRGALLALVVALGLTFIGLQASRDLQVGDLSPGAPELRAHSRYNLDNAYITSHYANSSDVFVVMVETGAEQCSRFDTLQRVDDFQFYLTQIPGVQNSVSLVDVAKRVTAGLNEGNLKWRSVSRNQFVINSSLRFVPSGLMNTDCSLLPVILFLQDHRASTLTQVTDAIARYAADHNDDQVRFLMGAGNAGFEAATNEVIAGAQYRMLLWVYGVVSLLCLLTFRSLRTVICIIAPLALTSLLCQALMARLGIGVKVATLPVIALGVGIGVDYGIYIYSKLNTYLNQGLALPEAYNETLKSTGKSVAFTGFTLAIGVILWVFSPIRFQADMGILLTFMFLWNMLGALILLPALTCLLHPIHQRWTVPQTSL